MLILGIQHMFAMFGATILVPIITGLSVQVTLICAGLGTLFFHLCTKFKVPAFLGSSFAFLGGFAAVKLLDTGVYANLTEAEKLPYACGGIVVAPFVSDYGRRGEICWNQTGNALFAAGCHRPDHHSHRPDPDPQRGDQRLGKLVAGRPFGGGYHRLQYVGKGMIKIILILMGVLIPYIVALCCGMIDFSGVAQADIVQPAPVPDGEV